jgi:hypothetical protein
MEAVLIEGTDGGSVYAHAGPEPALGSEEEEEDTLSKGGGLLWSLHWEVKKRRKTPSRRGGVFFGPQNVLTV